MVLPAVIGHMRLRVYPSFQVIGTGTVHAVLV